MNLAFTPQGWQDYQHWQQNDRQILKRVNRLLEDVMRTPTTGIGKPEQLRYGVDAWSRRITDEHRLVYRIKSNDIVVLQARYHYEK